MLPVLAELISPLLSLFIVVLGTGFSFTLFGVILTAKQVSPMIIGAMTGVFYAGLVLGSVRIEHFITRVGHIRAYAVFSSTLAIMFLIQGLYFSVISWLILRFIAGLATAGLYVVIESWLLYKTNPFNRGRILSLYMIIFYAAQSFGQFFLKLTDPQAIFLFALASMLCSLSIIPISMTKLPSPHYSSPSTLSLKVIISKTSTGLLGSLVSGMIMGALYGLLPSVLMLKFHTNHMVANFMFTLIIGGMLLQYPIGKLSDLVQRRLVFILLCLATIIISLVMFYFPRGYLTVWFISMALLGGLTFTLYPISIAHACDSLETPDLVAGTQTLLLSYSAGAMIGPFIAPLFMLFYPKQGLFIFLIAASIIAIVPFIFTKSVSVEENATNT